MLFLFHFFLPLLHFSSSTQPKLDNVFILPAVCGYEFYTTANLSYFCVPNCKECFEASKSSTKSLTTTNINPCTIAKTTLTPVSDFFSDEFLERETRIFMDVAFSNIFSNDTKSCLDYHGFYDGYSLNYCILRFNFIFFTKLESLSLRSVQKMP